MFWSICLDAHNRTKKVRTKTNFKLSNATLDLETIAEDEGSDSVAIWVKTNKKNTLLATLNQNVPQAQIDVAFGKGQSVEFYVRSHINNAAVYLSGYEIYDDDADLSVDADTIQMSSFNGSPSTSAVKMQSLQTNTSSGQSKLNQNLTKHAVVSEKTSKSKHDSESDDNSDDEELPMKKSKPIPVKIEGPRELKGGVTIEDVTVGDGKCVTKKSKVTLKYTVTPVGIKLLSSPVEVDVLLGQPKTLSCWSIGIPDMKVGGVRRITSPPTHAYGKKGIPPFINADATVVFEVTVIKCN